MTLDHTIELNTDLLHRKKPTRDLLKSIASKIVRKGDTTKPGIPDTKKYEQHIDNLDFHQHPIIIFTNRHEDGILHGATPVKRIHPKKHTSRPLYHVSIRYQETEKTPVFI